MINVFPWGSSDKSERVETECNNQRFCTVFSIIWLASWVHKVSFYICFGNYEQKCVFHYLRHFWAYAQPSNDMVYFNVLTQNRRVFVAHVILIIPFYHFWMQVLWPLNVCFETFFFKFCQTSPQFPWFFKRCQYALQIIGTTWIPDRNYDFLALTAYQMLCDKGHSQTFWTLQMWLVMQRVSLE